MLQKIHGEVIAVRPSTTRSDQDRIKLRIGGCDENIIDIYAPTGTYEVRDVVKLKLSVDGKRGYRDVRPSSTIIKNPS